MTPTDQAPAAAAQSTGKVFKNRWLNPRRKRFWAIVVILLYTLLGFFAAPPMIEHTIISLLNDDLGRPAKIEKIEANPYALSVRVTGFELQDTDGVKLASFDEFHVNFQFLSILKWAWTFSQIQLTGPYLHFERFDTGETRLGHLLEDFAANRPARAGDDKSADQANDVPRVLIRNLGISEGRVDFRDRLPATPVEFDLGPINISIQELNTLPDVYGQQAVAIYLPGDASLKWNGSLSLAPLESKGELVLEGMRIDPVIAYLEHLLPLETISASLSSAFKYQLLQEGSGDFSIAVDEFDIRLDDLLVSGLVPATDIAIIQQMSLLDGKFRYPGQTLHFGKLNIVNPMITAWLKEDGSLNLLDLKPDGATSGKTTESNNTASPWQLGIGQVLLEGGELALSDNSVQPAAYINLADLHARADGVNNLANAVMPFELSGKLSGGGNFMVNGELGALPGFSLSAHASIKGVPLSLGQPYVQQFAHILIETGVVDSAVDINVPAGQDYSVSGSVEIPGLKVNDELENETLLSWNNLEIDQFDLDPGTLHLSSLAFEGIYGRFVINDDRTTNLGGLVVDEATEPGENNTTETDSESMDFIIGGVYVNNGSLDFSDLSLPLPFATHIEPLEGTVSTIATNSTEPANIRLEGQVDEYGLARIEGGMNVLDPVRYTDVSVDFRNLEMSSLSPYTVQFAGREIDEGKLNLGLVYDIKEGQLHGTNEIILSDLVLGEKVDHPDAASLPLGLAVSLLKDANGVIDIDLPVEGDVNDPEFKIGGVIWQAFTGMITKVVSAPFRLLGSLIGIESEDFGQIEFLAGRADLTPPEMEKIVQLEEALQQRPELLIEISGVTDPAIDVPVMQYIRVRDIASERLGEGLEDKNDNDLMLDERIRGIVETLFSERFPDISPQSLKAAHTAPPADDPEGKPVLDELAYATDLWKRLLAAETVTDQDLTDLALARAEAIRFAFLATGQIDASRIVITEPSEVESDDGEWVMLELGVASE
jgi:hypothetical protein